MKNFLILMIILMSGKVYSQELYLSCVEIVKNEIRLLADSDYIKLYKQGIKYRDGEGIPKNLKKAFCLIEVAAQNGIVEAEGDLSWFYEADNRGQKKDPAKAFMISERAAQKGSLIGLNNMGVYYQQGFGTQKNLNKAIEYFNKAIKQGNLDIAKINLGYSYFLGLGVEQDFDKAIHLTMEVIKDNPNNDEAMAKLGVYYFFLEDFNNALYWNNKAVTLENSLAQINLGYMYAKGIGVEKNEGVALQLLEKAMLQNDPQAFFIMGELYVEEDSAFKKNYKNAFKYYLIAAEMGHGIAQNNVATLLINDRSGVKDEVKALEWYLKSAEENNVPESMYALYQIYGKGIGKIPQDLEKSRYWLEKAKENGFVSPK